MKSMHLLVLVSVVTFIVSGCSTTNSIPYKASTANVITIQQKLQTQGKKVAIGSVQMAPGIDESPLCRLAGPVVVAPGKTLPQYIKDAFQEELFLAQVYLPNAASTINARVDALTFSSVSPASWNISMYVSSNTKPQGYSVKLNYPFNTSWDAMSACRNVADAFGPAVQELLKQVVNDPGFSALAQ
jgi:hypothetical protein